MEKWKLTEEEQKEVYSLMEEVENEFKQHSYFGLKLDLLIKLNAAYRLNFILPYELHNEPMNVHYKNIEFSLWENEIEVLKTKENVCAHIQIMIYNFLKKFKAISDIEPVINPDEDTEALAKLLNVPVLRNVEKEIIDGKAIYRVRVCP